MISKFFINRPIFASVIAIVMVLVGMAVSYTHLREHETRHDLV